MISYLIGGVIAGLLIGIGMLVKEIVSYRIDCGHWRFWRPYWPKGLP